MSEETISIIFGNKKTDIHLTKVHTVVLGSGASGLNAAAQLYLNDVKDVLILTEGLSMGTSINTGSDKQTYYKLSMYGSDADSPGDMAETYFADITGPLGLAGGAFLISSVLAQIMGGRLLL